MSDVVDHGHRRSLTSLVLRYSPNGLGLALLGLATTAIFTRVLGPVEYGRYALILATAITVALISSSWFGHAVNRFVPQLDDDSRLEIGGVTIRFTVWHTAAVTVLGLGTAAWLYAAGRELRAVEFLLGALLVGSVAAETLVRAQLQARSRAARYTIVSTTGAATRLILGLVLASLVWKNGAALVIAAVLAKWVATTMGWRGIRRPSPDSWLRPSSSDGHVIRRYWTYGAPMLIWAAAGQVLGVADRWMLAALASTEAVGIYSANYGISAAGVNAVVTPFALVLHTHLMRHGPWEAGQQAPPALPRVIAVFVALTLYALAGVGLVGDDLSRRILGAPFGVPSTALLAIVGGLLMWATAMFVHKPLELRNRTRVLAALASSCGGLNLVANYILIPNFGVSGAAYATLLSYAAYLIAVWALQRDTRRLVPAVLRLSAADLGIAASLVISFGYLANVLSSDVVSYCGAATVGAAGAYRLNRHVRKVHEDAE